MRINKKQKLLSFSKFHIKEKIQIQIN